MWSSMSLALDEQGRGSEEVGCARDPLTAKAVMIPENVERGYFLVETDSSVCCSAKASHECKGPAIVGMCGWEDCLMRVDTSFFQNECASHASKGRSSGEKC